MEDIEQRIRQLEDEAFAAQHEGYHDKAIGFATSALDLARQHFGEDHIQFAAVLHVLAVLYDAEGKSDRAIPLLERALVDAGLAESK